MGMDLVEEGAHAILVHSLSIETLMKPSLYRKLEYLDERFEELKRLLSDPAVIAEASQFRAYSKEYASLEPLSQAYQAYQRTMRALSDAERMMLDTDPELKAMATAEWLALKQNIEAIESALQILLLPQDPNDNSNIFIEIRAAAGGDEAAIFAGNLFRMYQRYADNKGWQVELVNESFGEHGGYKSVVARIIGTDVYSHLKFESGAHRVQRVPETEAQGRVHTSTCTVVIMPEIDEIDSIDINPADLKTDTFRASGAGGQHVNKTDSAIRITHIPTGTVVECQDERSQHKNRARAMSLLRAKLLDQQRSKQQQEQADTRRSLVGTGDRSERIRTYNFPQSRLTDHRINLTLYRLEQIMAGAVDEVIDPLIREYQADLLAAMGD